MIILISIIQDLLLKLKYYNILLAIKKRENVIINVKENMIKKLYYRNYMKMETNLGHDGNCIEEITEYIKKNNLKTKSDSLLFTASTRNVSCFTSAREPKLSCLFPQDSGFRQSRAFQKKFG